MLIISAKFTVQIVWFKKNETRSKLNCIYYCLDVFPQYYTLKLLTNQILSTPTGEHSKVSGHSLADLNYGNSRKSEKIYIIKRERKYFINKYNKYDRGINKQI